MKLIALVIDDDEVVTFLHETLLKLAGGLNEIHAFNNGREALRFLEQHKGEDDCRYMVLLDINMPVMDGWDFLEAANGFLLKQCVSLYILSSSIDRNDISKAKGYGVVDGFLHKPLNLATTKRVFSQTEAKLNAL